MHACKLKEVRIIGKMLCTCTFTSTSFATRYGFVRNDLLHIRISIKEAILMNLTSSRSDGRVLHNKICVRLHFEHLINILLSNKQYELCHIINKIFWQSTKLLRSSSITFPLGEYNIYTIDLSNLKAYKS